MAKYKLLNDEGYKCAPNEDMFQEGGIYDETLNTGVGTETVLDLVRMFPDDWHLVRDGKKKITKAEAAEICANYLGYEQIDITG